MAKKTSGFNIREPELAKVLGITHPELDKIIQFFDSNPNDQWELLENQHFIYLNRSLNERLFSEQGAYAIAKYMDENSPKDIWKVIKEFITRHKEKLHNSFINRKIQDNCTSLTVRNSRHFLSKKDVVSIFCTNSTRLNKAFEEIQKSSKPMIIHEDFDDIDGVRYYSLLGFYKLSQNLAKSLTIKDRRAWCEAIEVVGKKTFKLIIDKQAAQQQRIESAMNKAKRRDGSKCQVTGIKRDKFNRTVNIVVHHIYSKDNYPHLADCQDNLITLTQEVHTEFHTWNGGFQKPCTADSFVEFVSELYPDNYEVTLRLKNIKQILNTPLPKIK